MIYNITCSTDDNFLQHCMAMLCSVYENNKEHEIHVHMMIDDKLSKSSRKQLSDLTSKYKNSIYFYDVESKLVDNFDESNTKYNGKLRFPMIVYYRLLIQYYLPKDIETVLYLDCDIIVLRDFEELFSFNLDSYGLAAIRDCSPYNSRHRRKMGLGLQNKSFCSGVMLINLKYWRLHDAASQFSSFFAIDKDFVCLPDQDALNYVFRDKWLQLPYKYGKTPYSISAIDKQQQTFDLLEYSFEPCIIHYSSSIKPWMNVWMPEKKYYIKYLYLSEFQERKIQILPLKLKFSCYVRNIRYILNKYIHPLVPNIIEILLLDIVNVVKFLCSFFTGRKTMIKHLLFMWISKYR